MQISENSGYRVYNGQMKFQAFDTVQCAQQLNFTLEKEQHLDLCTSTSSTNTCEDFFFHFHRVFFPIEKCYMLSQTKGEYICTIVNRTDFFVHFDRENKLKKKKNWT